jgi:hypothetical protein
MQHFLDGHQVHPIAVLVLNEPTNDAAPFHLGVYMAHVIRRHRPIPSASLLALILLQ